MADTALAPVSDDALRAEVADSTSSSRSAAMCLIAWKLPMARPNWMRERA